MKKIGLLAFLIFFNVICINAQTQTWEKVASTSLTANLNRIFFINNQTGWIAGEKGSIYKSTDGGLVWNQQSTTCSQLLNSIYFLDAQKGYIVGEKRKMLFTSNGGDTWKEDSISLPDNNASLRAVFFKDSLNGWLLASVSATSKLPGKGWILNTKDGGISWSIVLSVNKEMFGLSITSSGSGLACGRDIESFFYTKNGLDWSNSTTPDLIDYGTFQRKDIRSIQLVSDSIGYAVGFGSYSFAQPSLIFKTSDGGKTWKHIKLSPDSEPYELLYDIQFWDENNGIAVGGVIRGGVVLRTSDGGKNWSYINVPIGGSIKSISRTENKFWIAGSEGLAAASEDGINWRILSPIINSRLVSICFPTPFTGYAAGYSGAFAKTTNAGKTWSPSYISTDNKSFNVNAISFPDENIGFAAHTYGMVTKTTDGGITWTKIRKDTLTSIVNYGISFVNENFGVVVGKNASKNGIIYKTTDGGLSWNVKQDFTVGYFIDVALYNQQKAIIVGENLNSIYTENGGETWNFSALPSNMPDSKFKSNLRSVAFLDENTAIAVGDTIVFKSEDGGASWRNINLNPHLSFYKVAFEDNLTGYICGREEVSKINQIWKTSNSGETWVKLSDSLQFSNDFIISSVGISKPGLAFFTGTNGIIYKYETLISSVASSDLKDIRVKLAQNYPNPFNPSTWIEYEIPSDGNVKINVYNLLGQNVMTLINGYLQRGTYKVNFNGSTLSSGIYYYTLQYGDLIISKKMQLLK